MKIDQLEPDAKEGLSRAFRSTHGLAPDEVVANYLALSQAISLKRIADQLDGTAKGTNLWDMALGAYGKVMDR